MKIRFGNLTIEITYKTPMANIDKTKLPKEITDKYSVKDNTFFATPKPDVKDLITKEIGDSKTPDTFLPQQKITRWDNECNVSVRLKHDEKNPKVSQVGDKIMWKGDKVEAHFYDTKINTYEAFRSLNYGSLNQEEIKTVEILNTPYEKVLINGKIWGRDTIDEREKREKAGDEAYGDVLLVGLGVGVMNEYLLKNPLVTSITIVEISGELVNLVRNKNPNLFAGVEVIVDDFYHFAQITDKKFDYIYGDIWNTVALPYYNSWFKFKNEAEKLTKIDGIVKGRLKEIAESSIVSENDIEDASEFEVVLKEKPQTNKVEFTLNTKGVDFIFQPELTQEQKDNGSFQPENVVNSYAVYASEQKINYAGGKEYKCGKVGHIFRPKIIDSAGTEVWGDLHIEPASSAGENGILSVTIPQSFLDTAVYPVRHAAGLTFGYTTRGASTVVFDGNLIACSFTGAAGTGTSMTVSAMVAGYSVPTNKIKCAIFDASLNLVTNSTTTEKTDLAGSVGDWTLNFGSAPTFTAQTYWLAANGNATGYPKGEGTQYYYDAGSANQARYVSNVYTSFPPATLGAGTNQSYKYSIYATYQQASSPSVDIQSDLIIFN